MYITGSDNSTLSLKIVKPGESVTSLLSFIDVLIVSISIKFTSYVECYVLEGLTESVQDGVG